MNKKLSSILMVMAFLFPVEALANLQIETTVEGDANQSFVEASLEEYLNLSNFQEGGGSLSGTFLVRWGNLNGEVVAETPNLDLRGAIILPAGVSSSLLPVSFEHDVDLLDSRGEFTSITRDFDGVIVDLENELSTDDSMTVFLDSNFGEFSIDFTHEADLGLHELVSGYYLEVKRLDKRINPVSELEKTDTIYFKQGLFDEVESFYGSQFVNSSACLNTIRQVEDYAYPLDLGGQDVYVDFIAQLDRLFEPGATVSDCDQLLNKFYDVKELASSYKYNSGLLDFRDVDDNFWYSNYVSRVKNLGLVEGYKTDMGELTGEFGPTNSVKVGELLKVSVLFSERGFVDTEIENLKVADDHWSLEYLKVAENQNINLVEDLYLDVNRDATRGEVLSVLLELLFTREEVAEFVQECHYRDLAKEHPYYNAICLGTALGIVSGDDPALGQLPTFRPNQSVLRAELAKILVELNSLKELNTAMNS